MFVQEVIAWFNALITALVARMSGSETKDVVIDHELRGVTPDMIDRWWMLMGDTEIYKLWHPRDHMEARMEVGEEGGRTTFTHCVLEKVGGIPSRMRIRLEDPDTVDIPREYSHVVTSSVLDSKGVPYAWVQHQYEEMEGGTRMRSTFRIPAKAPTFFVKGLRKHNREEMGQFPVFLPGLLEKIDSQAQAGTENPTA